VPSAVAGFTSSSFQPVLRRIRRYPGDLADAVLVAQEMRDFLVENLPGKLPGLAQDDRAVFRYV